MTADTKSGLSARLREATRSEHARAERSGIMQALLHGRIERIAYHHLLRNLHALYVVLEDALERHAGAPLLEPVRFPEVYRARALQRDLAFLHGARWEALPVAQSMREYAKHLLRLADDCPGLLAAHAYVRYLGDLSGGQLLRGIVARGLHLADGTGTQFYDFGPATDVATHLHAFRNALNALPAGEAAADGIVAEARAAFERHAQLFEQLAVGETAAPSVA